MIDETLPNLSAIFIPYILRYVIYRHFSILIKKKNIYVQG